MEVAVLRGGHVEAVLLALVLQQLTQQTERRLQVTAVKSCRLIGRLPQHHCDPARPLTVQP